LKIIGTLGADILEKKLTVLNFKDDYCFFGNEIPASLKSIALADFEFEKKRYFFLQKLMIKAKSFYLIQAQVPLNLLQIRIPGSKWLNPMLKRSSIL
jgi:hypothetical protein